MAQLPPEHYWDKLRSPRFSWQLKSVKSMDVYYTHFCFVPTIELIDLCSWWPDCIKLSPINTTFLGKCWYWYCEMQECNNSNKNLNLNYNQQELTEDQVMTCCTVTVGRNSNPRRGTTPRCRKATAKFFRNVYSFHVLLSRIITCAEF